MRLKRVTINGQFNHFVGTPSTANSTISSEHHQRPIQPFRRTTINGQFNHFVGSPSMANSCTSSDHHQWPIHALRRTTIKGQFNHFVGTPSTVKSTTISPENYQRSSQPYSRKCISKEFFGHPMSEMPRKAETRLLIGFICGFFSAITKSHVT